MPTNNKENTLRSFFVLGVSLFLHFKCVVLFVCLFVSLFLEGNLLVSKIFFYMCFQFQTYLCLLLDPASLNESDLSKFDETQVERFIPACATVPKLCYFQIQSALFFAVAQRSTYFHPLCLSYLFWDLFLFIFYFWGR